MILADIHFASSIRDRFEGDQNERVTSYLRSQTEVVEVYGGAGLSHDPEDPEAADNGWMIRTESLATALVLAHHVQAMVDVEVTVTEIKEAQR